MEEENRILNIILQKSKGDILPKESVLKDVYRDRIIIFLQIATCSIVAGIRETEKAIRNYLNAHQVDADIIESSCMGMCSNDPIIDILIPGRTKISFKKVYAQDITSIFDSILNNILPDKSLILCQYRSEIRFPWEGVPYFEELTFFAKQKRLLLEYAGKNIPDSLNNYFETGGFDGFAKALFTLTPGAICKNVIESGLTGRGGGGYSTGEKLKTVLQQQADKKYLICNADESDPGSFSDRLLIESNPFLLIEGIMIASLATGAEEAIVYIRNQYHLAIERINNALLQLYNNQLLGSDILGSGFHLNISVYQSPGAYVCGEETALIENLEGNRGMPRTKPPFPAISGYKGMPTVVNNVETLCNIPHIIAKGSEWFKTLGNDFNTGTKLFSISGKTEINGVIEMEMGSMVSDVINVCGGGKNEETIKAVHLGGPSGGLLPQSLFDVPLDYYHLKQQSLYLGSGSFTVLDNSNCIVDMCMYFMDFIRSESCGKCIPCREGSQRMVEIFSRIMNKPDESEEFSTLLRFKGVMQLEQMIDVMKQTSLCGLGQNASNVVSTAITHFRDEFEEHIFERKCKSLVCRNLKAYVIDHEKCTGCGICARRCPSDAIAGSLKQAHYIIVERCTNCGLCMESCKFNAVIQK